MGSPCFDCGGPTSGRGKSGRCRPCSLARVNRSPEIVAKRSAAATANNKARRHARPHCACGKELSLGAVRCRPCNMTAVLHRPEVKAKSAQALSLRHRSDPAFHERHRERVKLAIAERMQDPAFVAAKSEAGRRVGALNLEKTRGPESRAKAGRAISAARLAHIPADQRDLYRDLIRKKVPAAEAIILVAEQAEIERQRAPRLVRQSEQQMRARAEQREQEAY